MPGKKKPTKAKAKAVEKKSRARRGRGEPAARDKKAGGAPAMTRHPLLVQFEYHTGSTDAASLAEYLHGALNDDPAVPGLRIPTVFIPHEGTNSVPEPRLAGEADRILVVVLADDHLAAHAHRPSTTGPTWAEYVVKLRELCNGAGPHRFMPVQLTQHAWPIDARLEDLNFLRAWAIDDEKERRRFIARPVSSVIHFAA
jgi:hypothetical protein